MNANIEIELSSLHLDGTSDRSSGLNPWRSQGGSSVVAWK
jgi:hypothetical protein